jgi:tetratricopeptide (TPR) repeat protein
MNRQSIRLLQALRATVTAGLLVVSSFANSGVASTPLPVIERARVLIESGKAEAAVDLLKSAQKSENNDAQLAFWLGRAYGGMAENAGAFKMMSIARDARDSFAVAVRIDPSFVEARFALMEFYLMAPGFMGGGDDKARAEAEAIRRLDKLAGYRAFAALASADDESEKARALFETAVKEFSDVPESYYHFGIYLDTQEKDRQAARQMMERALSVDPDFMPAHFQLGRLSLLTDTGLGKGEASLQRYVAHVPKLDAPPMFRAYYWLGLIKEKQGDRTKAQSFLRRSAQLRPNHPDTEAALERVARS